MENAMSSLVSNRRLASRLLRNLVVTIAVTSIFALKAMEPGPFPVELMTLASR
jgi:hypothetical protein